MSRETLPLDPLGYEHIELTPSWHNGVPTTEKPKEKKDSNPLAKPSPRFFLHDETIAWLQDNMKIGHTVHLSAARGTYVSKLALNGQFYNSMTAHLEISVAGVPICETHITLPLDGYTSAIETLVNVNENLMIAVTRHEETIDKLQAEIETLKNQYESNKA